MKKKYFIIFILLLCNIVSAENDTSIFDKMISLIQSEKHDKAAGIWAETGNGTIEEGYSMVAFNLSRNNKTGEHTKLIYKYYNKACNEYEYIRCIDYGKFLEKQKRYKEAEILYILFEKKHHDHSTLERLYLLYRNPKWSGYDLDKSKYWWDKYFDVMEDRKAKRDIARKKYGLDKSNN